MSLWQKQKQKNNLFNNRKQWQQTNKPLFKKRTTCVNYFIASHSMTQATIEGADKYSISVYYD